MGKKSPMIYTRIKDICSDKGLTISSVEKQAGLPNGSISKWDTSEPLAISLKKVADVLKVPLEAILGEER